MDWMNEFIGEVRNEPPVEKWVYTAHNGIDKRPMRPAPIQDPDSAPVWIDTETNEYYFYASDTRAAVCHKRLLDIRKRLEDIAAETRMLKLEERELMGW